jgi:3-oxoacyl-[acyl-carrier protein] reductase
MNLGIENRVALVTGAIKNIGRAIALELAKEGARVIFVGRTDKKLDDVMAELSGGLDQHFAIDLDLQLPESPSILKEMLVRDYENPDFHRNTK